MISVILMVCRDSLIFFLKPFSQSLCYQKIIMSVKQNSYKMGSLSLASFLFFKWIFPPFCIVCVMSLPLELTSLEDKNSISVILIRFTQQSIGNAVGIKETSEGSHRQDAIELCLISKSTFQLQALPPLEIVLYCLPQILSLYHWDKKTLHYNKTLHRVMVVYKDKLGIWSANDHTIVNAKCIG